MKTFTCLMLLILLGFSPLFAQQDTWTQKANFFETREGAVSFTINNKLYVGTGNEKNDLWEYNPSTNVWTQKASLPAAGRSYATGFSIGNKGYIATGSKVKILRSGTSQYILDSLMRDVWEYDPLADSWSRKADIRGVGRARAVAFVLNNKAYMGSGEGFGSDYPLLGNGPVNRASQIFSVFDPIANTWTRLADIPFRRINAIAFTGNGKGYIGTGFYNTYRTTPQFDTDARDIIEGDNLQDLWAYDIASNTWVKKSDFPGGKRMGMSVFGIGDTVYTMGGAETADQFWPSDSDHFKKDVWAYNTVTDTWIQEANFPGTARRYAIAAAIAGKGYFGTGRANDLWEYAFLPGGGPLPVTLVSFAGSVQNNKTKLEWRVENEHDLDHYEVYRSVDGSAFSKSGEVKALNKRQYTYEDNPSSTTQIFYYRLKIIDKDGSFSYSKIITLINNKQGIEIGNIYPSPIKGTSGYLNITSGSAQKLQIIITDIAGHQLSTQRVLIREGSNVISLNFNKLASGTYLLKIIDEKQNFNTIRFIIHQ